MVSKVITGTFAALISLAGSNAFAQEWDWTPDRERGFYERYSTRPDPRPGFSITLGGVVPNDVEIYDAPEYDYAPARKYRYLTNQKKIYVVDPATRKVVRVFEK